MSEKLDGMRAIWDGSGFFTRTGGPLYAPAEFLTALPVGFCLDGNILALT